MLSKAIHGKDGVVTGTQFFELPTTLEEVHRLFAGGLSNLQQVVNDTMPEPFTTDPEFNGIQELRVRPYAISWVMEQRQPDGHWKGTAWGKTSPERKKIPVASCVFARTTEKAAEPVPPPSTPPPRSAAIKRPRPAPTDGARPQPAVPVTVKREIMHDVFDEQE